MAKKNPVAIETTGFFCGTPERISPFGDKPRIRGAQQKNLPHGRFFRGTPERIRTAGLQSRSLKNAVFYRLIKWLKVLKIKAFLILPFDNVGRNNSTFHIGVELLLNFSGLQSEHKKPLAVLREGKFRRSSSAASLAVFKRCSSGIYRKNSVSSSTASIEKFAVKIGTNFLFQILWQLGKWNTRGHRRSERNLSPEFVDGGGEFFAFTSGHLYASFLCFIVG